MAGLIDEKVEGEDIMVEVARRIGVGGLFSRVLPWPKVENIRSWLKTCLGTFLPKSSQSTPLCGAANGTVALKEGADVESAPSDTVLRWSTFLRLDSTFSSDLTLCANHTSEAVACKGEIHLNISFQSKK